MRVCKPNPQVLLHAPQEPVVHVYAVQFEGSRDNPGLPTAPLSTSVGVAAADAEGLEDGRVDGVEDGGVVGVEDGGAGGTWHKLHVCLQLALHNMKGKSVSATSAAECGSMLYCDLAGCVF